MGEFNNQQQSIFGTWWEPIRKWFYPAWLIYETLIRFYNYALSVHSYCIDQQEYIGEIATQILAIFCGIATFAICTFYLTVPASYTLYKFFKNDNPTIDPVIHKLKTYF